MPSRAQYKTFSLFLFITSFSSFTLNPSRFVSLLRFSSLCHFCFLPLLLFLFSLVFFLVFNTFFSSCFCFPPSHYFIYLPITPVHSPAALPHPSLASSTSACLSSVYSIAHLLCLQTEAKGSVWLSLFKVPRDQNDTGIESSTNLHSCVSG